jgi:hypothetical protein
MSAWRGGSCWSKASARFAVVAAVTAAVAAAAAPAAADPGQEIKTLRRHGSVARHFWAPVATHAELAGMPLSAGLAIGLRGPARALIGARIAPALVLHTGARSNLSLLANERGGVAVVWQRGI